jgi:bacillolysin
LNEKRKLAALAAMVAIAACSSSEERIVPAMPTREPRLSEQLEQDTGIPWLVTTNPTFGTPSFVEPKSDGPVELAPNADAEAVARAWLRRYASFFDIVDVSAELELEAVDRGGVLGFTHVVFRQKTRGLRVDGTRVGLHFDRAGRIAFVSSAFAPRAREVSVTPKIDVSSAEQTARAAMAAPAKTPAAASELVVEPRAKRLVHRFALASQSTIAASIVDVDAQTGALVRTKSALRDATATVTARGARGDHAIVINAPQEDGTYSLQRSGGDGSGLVAFDGREFLLTIFTSPDGVTWDDAPGTKDPRAAVDAFANLSRAQDWYRPWLGAGGHDGTGTWLDVTMHACSDRNNAYYSEVSGGISVCDGEGPGKTASIAVALDMMTHELQHAVTGRFLGLVYENQSGALDESLSDVFAVFVEHATGGGDPTLIGEAALSPPARSMVDPASIAGSGAQPDSMFWLVTSGIDYLLDHEGVHINSGIPNKAFALFTLGGTHGGSSVPVETPVGWSLSADVYRDLLQGRAVGPRATFEEFALAHVNIARRSGEDAKRASVCAWRAVEVFDDQTTKTRWGIDCKARHSCLANKAPCSEGKRCAWNGEATGYCCRTPRPGNEQTDLCIADSDCPAGKVCSYGRDDLLFCQDPEAGDDTCERPPGGE